MPLLTINQVRLRLGVGAVSDTAIKDRLSKFPKHYGARKEMREVKRSGLPSHRQRVWVMDSSNLPLLAKDLGLEVERK